MRVRAIAAAVVCLSVPGVSGCVDSGHSCGYGDYAVEGQRGFATPREVLRSVLAANPSLSQDGWLAASRAARSVVFRSGDDEVGILKKSDGERQQRLCGRISGSSCSPSSSRTASDLEPT